MPSGSAFPASGSPSTTTWRGSPARATAVVIGHVASATSTIRVGSGGIMLPNHAPLVIAEQFGTLESLYPGRIDLGLGRAPGGDGMVLRALRRGPEVADRFPSDVQELQFFFRHPEPDQAIRAVPGAGLDVPIWLLGSSTYSAQLAAALGLPFAFAAHFAPDALGEALALYRSDFKPSAALDRPRAMVAVTIVAADTDARARRLFTSLQQAFIALQSGTPGMLQPPVDDLDAIAPARVRARRRSCASLRNRRRTGQRRGSCPGFARGDRRRRADDHDTDP